MGRPARRPPSRHASGTIGGREDAIHTVEGVLYFVGRFDDGGFCIQPAPTVECSGFSAETADYCPSMWMETQLYLDILVNYNLLVVATLIRTLCTYTVRNIRNGVRNFQRRSNVRIRGSMQMHICELFAIMKRSTRTASIQQHPSTVHAARSCVSWDSDIVLRVSIKCHRWVPR